MRIVVTGAAGFLASHLVDRLLAEGHEVVAMDNLITGNLKNLEHLKDRPDFSLINIDVTSYLHVEGEVDWVLHFACPASPIDYLQLPIETLKVGSLGTYNTLGLAHAKKASYLLASSSEVYGDPQEHPQKETYFGHVDAVSTRGVYDEAKRFGEALVMAYHRTHGMDSRIVRIFNSYGSRMRPSDGRAIPAFVNQALRGEDLTIFGDGSQTRSFCYVKDTVEGIYRLMLSDYNYPVNIGNPDEMTITELANKIISMTASKSKLIYKDLPENDPKIRRPDISLARELLDWSPVTPLEEGLEKTIDYFKSLL
ncbi:MAG: SDR family oxidoreductase [Elusimicrobia bacterium]|nr:SDR family oxidoreductase [Elusimicrobiota bacterium]